MINCHEQKKVNQVFIGIITISLISVFIASYQSEQEQACECLRIKSKYDNPLSQTREVRNTTNRYGDKFDAGNNIQRICEREQIKYK